MVFLLTVNPWSMVAFTLVTKDDVNVNYIAIHDVTTYRENVSYHYPRSRTPMYLRITTITSKVQLH